MRVSLNALCLSAAWCAAVAVLSAAPDPITVTGCVTRTADSRLLLVALPSDAATASHGAAGSNTSKASIPIRSGQGSSERAAGGTTMTAKGSTPIKRGSGLLDAAGSGGANTSKASTPVGRIAPNVTGYELDGPEEGLASYVGHILSVTGAASRSASASKLTVGSVRVMSADCSTRSTR